MYESTNYTAIIVVSIVVYAIVFGIACSYLGKSKNRDPSNYFFLGFFLGIIGLIVAAGVPKLEKPSGTSKPSLQTTPIIMYRITCFYLRQDSRGTGVVKEGLLDITSIGIEFSWKTIVSRISFDHVVSIDTIASPEVLRISEQLLGPKRNRTVVKIQSLDDGKTAITYISFANKAINKTLQNTLNRWRLAEERRNSEKLAEQRRVAEYKTCPYCAETIKAEAIKCKHCGSDLVGAVPDTAEHQIGKITHDIKIGDQLVFSVGEQIIIEKLDPDPNRPEYQYVVLSKSLGKRFRLSIRDIHIQ